MRALGFWLCLFLMSLGAQAAPTEWKWSGDVRLRAQNEALEGQEPRLSERLRLRVGMNALVQSDLRVEIRLASMPSNRSTNQTLGDNKEPGFARRYIGLDLAYAEWKPLSEVKFNLGRIPQAHFRPGGSQLLLDDDLALEGASGIFEIGLDGEGSWSVFGSVGSTLIRENYDSYYSEKQTDNRINWVQLGLQWRDSSWKASVGGGFFNFVGLKGRLFSELVTGGSSLGNTEASGGVIKNEYLPRELFFEGSYRWSGYELGVFVEHLINSETEDPHLASWLGVVFARKPWEFHLAYATVDSDVVPALFTNSDFGAGRVDVDGYVANLKWNFKEKMSLRLSQFINRVKMPDGALAYNRTHLDLSASF